MRAREVDLLCERLFPFRMHDENGWGVYRVQLFVECKYIKGPVVFWFDAQDRERTLQWLHEHTPFTRGRTTSHRKHRYINTGTHVAKLFRSDKGRHPPGWRLNAALRRLGYSGEEMTGHGFRSMASTCLNDLGWHPDLIELQLAHAERNRVRAAYNRAQRSDKRRKMMQAWADYIDGLRAGNNVVPLKISA